MGPVTDQRVAELNEAGLAELESVEPLVFNPNNAVTAAVERLALTDGTSVVRKVLHRDAPAPVPHWAAGAHRGHWNYWRREVDAYDSRVVRSFEPHLRAPDLLGRVSRGTGVEVLLLEDVPGATGFEFGVEDLARAAGALGRAQGGSATGWRTRGFQSASREWIWSYATSRPPGPVGYADAQAWEHPVVVAGFGRARHELRRRFGELQAELWWWRRSLASCPPTLCHLDFWSPNIVFDGAGAVLVDWSFAGLGAVGEDPGNLVAAVMLDHQFGPESYDDLDDAVTSAYLAGLSESSWPHDPDRARFALWASVAKYVWMPAAMVSAADHDGPTGYAGRDGPELVEVFTRRAQVLLSMLERIGRARRLARQLGLVG